MESAAEVNESLQQNDIKEEPEIIKEEPMSDGEDEIILPDIPDIVDVDPLQIDNIKQEESDTVSNNSENKGYESWCHHRKQELKEKFPDLSRYKISKLLNEEWSTLPGMVKVIWNNREIPPQSGRSIIHVKPTRQSSRPRKPKEFKDIPEISEVKKKSTRPFKRQYLSFTLCPDNYDPKRLELVKIQKDALEAQSKKKEKEKKKRPMLRCTGYNLWAKEIGESLRKQCPLMTFSDISKHVAEMWRQLSDLERYNFRRRAKRINDKLTKDCQLTKEEKDNDDAITRVSRNGRVLAKSKKLSNFCAFENKYKTRFRKIKAEQSSDVSNRETEDAKQNEEQNPICNPETEKKRKIKVHC